MKIDLPFKVKPLLQDISQYRWIILHGGRSSGKSHSIAIILLMLAAKSKLRILCVREFQSSMRESCHKLLCDYIDSMGLSWFYDTTNNRIAGRNGSEFIFTGIKQNPQSVKSMEGIDICWCEEGQVVSKESKGLLTPTIRKDGSQIWVSMNPLLDTDPMYQLIINPPPNSLIIEMNYLDNPFNSQTIIDEAEYQKEVDYDLYCHIWLGHTLRMSDAVIFKGKFEVLDFDPSPKAQFRIGVDFGYTDSLAATSSYIDGDYLYIYEEAGGTKIETDDMPDKLIEGIPDIRKWAIYADSADPKAILFLKRRGFQIKGVKKGPNSILDGINYLKSFRRIYIHPRCVNTINEFKNYKWKQDRMTEEILPQPEDKWNHYIDSIRYAMEDIALGNSLTLSQWKNFATRK